MTDPTRFKVNWKNSSLFSPSDNSSSIHDFKFSTTLLTDVQYTPFSPSQHQQERPNFHHNTSFQSFAPFDVETGIETTLKDGDDYDELSILLSRQVLEDVDADPLPTTSSLTYPHSDLATIPESLWCLGNGKINKTWSPSLAICPLLSPPLSSSTSSSSSSQKHPHRHHHYPQDAFDYNSDSTSSSSPSSSSSSTAVLWWDRFGPYGNDSEFDPTLQKENDGASCFTTTTSLTDPTFNTMMSPPNGYHHNHHNQQQQQQQDSKLGETMVTLDYDTERTSLSNRTILSTQTPKQQQQQQQQQQSPLTNVSSPKKRQVCRYYLAGDCYRKHCWFAHDLEVKPCKFWLQGSCLKGDTCEFAHRLEELDDDHLDTSSINTNSMINNTHRLQEPQYPTMADFTIFVAKSSRKPKKSHNKKSFKK